MTCCGSQRAQLGLATQRSASQAPADRPSLDSSRYPIAYFQYTGATGLTVIGPMTSKRYRFDAPGAIVAVELADRASIATVPQLRQVRGP